MTRAECESKYGKISGGMWPLQSQHCITIEIPPEISAVVINSITKKPWTRVYLNRDMAKPLLKALKNVVERGCLDELKTFDGCFNIRPVRGEKALLSSHSWAGSLDLNSRINPLGYPSSWTPEFVKCFTDEGFAWGGNFARLDPMHYSWLGF